ncbi:MAG: hypothetical protein LUC43_04700, partial [Burkholderiales bacterium]|nr:hypothetical protein [Burkholderiales bacterium]
NIVMLSSWFDSVSSSSLDTINRSHSISDSVATSIMNDNALSKNLAMNLKDVVDLLYRNNPTLTEDLDQENRAGNNEGSAKVTSKSSKKNKSGKDKKKAA